MSKPHLAFCPICNKGRKSPLPNSILSPTDIQEIYRCNTCKRLFKDDVEVTVEVRTKEEKKGMDLRKMIPNWYRCPVCREVIVGEMEWYAHTWKKHQLREGEFEAKYGKPEYSYYGLDFKNAFNPSKRNIDE